MKKKNNRQLIIKLTGTGLNRLSEKEQKSRLWSEKEETRSQEKEDIRPRNCYHLTFDLLLIIKL